jgi:spore protease
LKLSQSLLKKLGISLDLAVEAHSLLRGDTGQEIHGVKEDVKKLDYASVTTIQILNDEGAKKMGKAPGYYITIEAPSLRENNPELHQKIADLFGKELENMLYNLGIKDNEQVLIIGLGNWDATPDALGPKVASKVLVTRHLYTYSPKSLQSGLRPLSALSPGVLGITGIETAEIVRGVIDNIKPKAVIAVDALAAMNLNRISSTIQIADTGIYPGSGIGNKRMAITKENLGVPVIAVGIPTVVHAAVVVSASLQHLVESQPIQQTLLNDNTIQHTIQTVLQPFHGNLTVTPKEIDELIENNARILASGLNQALHPAIGPEEGSIFMH